MCSVDGAATSAGSSRSGPPTSIVLEKQRLKHLANDCLFLLVEFRERSGGQIEDQGQHLADLAQDKGSDVAADAADAAH